MSETLLLPEILYGTRAEVLRNYRRIARKVWNSESWEIVSSSAFRPVEADEPVAFSDYAHHFLLRSYESMWHPYLIGKCLDDIFDGYSWDEQLIEVKRYQQLNLSGMDFAWFAVASIDSDHRQTVAGCFDTDLETFSRPLLEQLVKWLPFLCQLPFSEYDAGMGWGGIIFSLFSSCGARVAWDIEAYERRYGSNVLGALLELQLIKQDESGVWKPCFPE